MEIDQILKQATAFKRSNGYSYALDFLIGSYDASKPDDLPQLLNKIYTYFSHELNNQKVKEFILQLINSKAIEQYSGLLSSYYRMLHRRTARRETCALRKADVAFPRRMHRDGTRRGGEWAAPHGRALPALLAALREGERGSRER